MIKNKIQAVCYFSNNKVLYKKINVFNILINILLKFLNSLQKELKKNPF